MHRVAGSQQPARVRGHQQDGEILVGDRSDPCALAGVTEADVVDHVVIDGGKRGKERASIAPRGNRDATTARTPFR